MVGRFGAFGKLGQVLVALVLVGAVAFIAFIVWNAVQLSESNDWAAIQRIVVPIVGFALLAVVTAAAAVIAGRAERRHELAVVGAGASAAGAAPQTPVVVPSRPWRGPALGGLAIVALSFSIISSARLGQLRTGTEFELRDKHNVAQCDAWNCTESDYNALQKTCAAAKPSDDAYVSLVEKRLKEKSGSPRDYGDNCFVHVESCTGRLLAPSSASTDDQVAIDLIVTCDDAPAQRMPRVSAVYFGEAVTNCDPEDKVHGHVARGWSFYRHPTGEVPCYRRYGNEQPSGTQIVHRSFALAKTTVPTERAWRWFVSFRRADQTAAGSVRGGDHPIDVQLTFLDDTVAVPLKTIAVAAPTTLATLEEYTTALGGVLGAIVGLLGTLGSLVRGLRGPSSTVVAALRGAFVPAGTEAVGATPPADAGGAQDAEPPATPPP